MFGWKGALTAGQTAEIAEAKQVIYDAFKAAVEDGVPKAKAAILVDEQFGAAILRDARRNVTPPPALPRRVDKMNSNSNTATTSPTTSRPSGRPSARCWCDTTRRATRLSIGGKQNDSGGCQIICIATGPGVSSSLSTRSTSAFGIKVKVPGSFGATLAAAG